MSFHCRLSLLSCEFISVTFRSAKGFLENATFAEQKTTLETLVRINSQPIRESAVAGYFRGAKGDTYVPDDA